jgi:hypothetical protein
MADLPGGRVSLATQAGFALHGFADMARRWEAPWFLTLPS